MKAFIYTGGSVLTANITEHPHGDDLRIAADSGYNNAKLLGERIDTLIGDFDSIGHIPDEGDTEVLQVPAEKDLTDTQLAVELAISRGADDITIVGGLGCRMDHSMSTMYILENLHNRGIHGYITNGYNRIHYIRASSTLVARSGYKYLSLIAADDVKGLSIEGCKYPLKRAKLRRGIQYAISNEITGNCALISLRKGSVFVIESRD